jgi:hypothetical protein
MKTIHAPASIQGPCSQAQLSAPCATPTLSPAARRRPPCATQPNDWDLDVGTPDSWRTAVQTCHGCPIFDECTDLAQSLIARGLGPRAMIWAGIAYDGAGRVVPNLDRHRVAAIDHKRPLRIIRNGNRPEHIEASAATPQRHLVLGRRLRPTGTGGCEYLAGRSPMLLENS